MSAVDYFPLAIQWRRDAVNGDSDRRFYPVTSFYARAITAENHATMHRHKDVFGRAWHLGDASYGYSGSRTIARWRFRSGIGATRLRVALLLSKDNTGGVAVDPYVEVNVVEVGVGTTTLGPYRWGRSPIAGDDVPDDWWLARGTTTITPNATYECTIVTSDYARVMSVAAYELGEPTISEDTDYYNQLVAQAGTQIFDTTRSRLLVGLSEMHRLNGGTVCHWGLADGTARTRTSATAINLIDNATVGAPSAASPGWHIDLTYHRTHAVATVPVTLAVYGSIPTGSGTVTLRSSAGTVVGTVTVNNATPQWFTATATLAASPDKYDLQFASDGTHSLSVLAVSLYE